MGMCSADPGEELESHWFIENFMVLANEQVASFLEKEHVPTVYRVHDLPDPFRVDHLLDVLASLGLPTPLFDPHDGDLGRRAPSHPGDGRVDRHPRGRGPGEGGPHPAGSSGAGPGRLRYGEHRALRAGVADILPLHLAHPPLSRPAGAPRPPGPAWGWRPSRAAAFLSDWAEHCSTTERQAAKIELKADDIVLAHLLKRRLDEEGWSERLRRPSIKPDARGMFVLFDRLFQGYLSIRELPRDDYRSTSWRPRSRADDRAGPTGWRDMLPVRVLAVDEVQGRVDLTLAGSPPGDDPADGRQAAPQRQPGWGRPRTSSSSRPPRRGGR